MESVADFDDGNVTPHSVTPKDPRCNFFNILKSMHYFAKSTLYPFSGGKSMW